MGLDVVFERPSVHVDVLKRAGSAHQTDIYAPSMGPDIAVSADGLEVTLLSGTAWVAADTVIIVTGYASYRRLRPCGMAVMGTDQIQIVSGVTRPWITLIIEV